ncbi:MAG: tRNA preQ1(34) S-adenosylmethionine ribosyltransferase-isomerase QueA [Alphaproteobacteria bacterium]|nr:tRNA preQ1(34) S-adenosylmethionine ribosyltransferase-isomerase QueA [Alphaproteobacteria bacterium]
MDISHFDFNLPPELIAQFPASQRDQSRLLVVGAHGALTSTSFIQILDFMESGDVLVFNNTKVIPARLYGKRGDIQVEILLHKRQRSEKETHELTWDVFAKPAKRLKIGHEVIFAADFKARVIDKKETGEVILSFAYPESEFYRKLEINGHMPLPPYIARDEEGADQDRYQTIYAKHEGAVAAPTAGLHFSQSLMEQLRAKGIILVEVTLHVGAGTFQPVKVDNITEHHMHYEWCELTDATAAVINTAKAAGQKIIAVGTTSVRVLETAAHYAEDRNAYVMPFAGETNIFITPGYPFKVIDRLITNFHLPKSTLFMLVSAFAGLDEMKRAYAYAIEERFRFYSYGDACLIFPYESPIL